MAIRSCGDRRTADFIAGKGVVEFQVFECQAMKAVAKLQAVTRMVELRNPPSNRSEALGGNRKGQYSIRINDRWRICFSWKFVETSPSATDELTQPGEPYDVEIVDYRRG